MAHFLDQGLLESLVVSTHRWLHTFTSAMFAIMVVCPTIERFLYISPCSYVQSLFMDTWLITMIDAQDQGIVWVAYRTKTGAQAHRPPPALRPTALAAPELFPIVAVRGIGVQLARDFSDSLRSIQHQFASSSSRPSPMVLSYPTHYFRTPISSLA